MLLLRKDVYLYEYMDDWDKFNDMQIMHTQKEFVKILK